MRQEPIEELLVGSKVSEHEGEKGAFYKTYTLFLINEVAVNFNMGNEEVESDASVTESDPEEEAVGPYQNAPDPRTKTGTKGSSKNGE